MIAKPDTFIPNDRFHALIERLKEINEADNEARDKAIQWGKRFPQGGPRGAQQCIT